MNYEIYSLYPKISQKEGTKEKREYRNRKDII